VAHDHPASWDGELCRVDPGTCHDFYHCHDSQVFKTCPRSSCSPCVCHRHCGILSPPRRDDR